MCRTLLPNANPLRNLAALLSMLAGVCGYASGCGEPPVTPTERALPADLGDGCLLVHAAEFGVEGAVGTVDLRTGTVAPRITSTFHDATLHPWTRGAFVLNRLGRDSVQALDASRGWATVFEAPLPERANPWDIYVDDAGVGVVAGYGSGSLHPFAIEGDDLQWSTPRSLREVADADGNAEPAFLWRRDDRLVVVVQRLRAFGCSEVAPAIVTLAWPSLTEPTVQPLPGCNPSDVAHTESGTWIALSGAFRSLAATFWEPITDDGGLVWLANGADAIPQLLVDETRLGGDVVSLANAQDGGVWVTVADERNAMRVDHVQRVDGEVAITPTGIDGRTLFDVRDVGGALLAADRDPVRPGLVLLDVADGGVSAGPVSGPLPPVAFLDVPNCGAGR